MARAKKSSRHPKDSVPRAAGGQKLNALPDTVDFRDRMFVPTLVEVPVRIDLAEYRLHHVPILDQGTEGACTGFGLATVANFLLRRRKIVPDLKEVSPRMLYTMAKRYDEWPGEDYDGSSARGAMKGWHKHGVCSKQHWEYKDSDQKAGPFKTRWDDATRRPLGAYFRVDHTNLVAMHTALAEVRILYVTSSVHKGWDDVGKDGRIKRSTTITGGHAFAIVAYDERGFWIQNSWAADWGFHGFAHIGYDDWLANGTDTWVARLGVPIVMADADTAPSKAGAPASAPQNVVFNELRPHVISLGNDGQPRAGGTFGTTADEIAAIFDVDFPAITADWPARFGKRRLLLYAHGGLVGEDAAIQMASDDRQALLDVGVYPVSFIWHSDYLSTLRNVLEDALRRRRPEGLLDSAKDFMLDRLDDALEPVARVATGLLEWSQMKQNAISATTSKTGGARIAAKRIAALQRADPTLEIHVAAHSAGAILLAPFVRLLASKGAITAGPLEDTPGLGRTISSCTLWAPACTMALFQETYLPAMTSGALKHFALFALTDKAERDDNCAGIYHKSLLYLVSNAFEDRPRIPLIRDGVPLLGMAKFIAQDKALVERLGSNWVLAPNAKPVGDTHASGARHHGDFNDDMATLQATLARILSGDKDAAKRAEHVTLKHRTAPSALRSARRGLEAAANR